MHSVYLLNDTEVKSDMNETVLDSWNDTGGCGVELSDEDREIISHYRFELVN